MEWDGLAVGRFGHCVAWFWVESRAAQRDTKRGKKKWIAVYWLLPWNLHLS
jgi:hypothetical protein